MSDSLFSLYVSLYFSSGVYIFMYDITSVVFNGNHLSNWFVLVNFD